MPQNTERVALTEAVYYILLALQQPMHGYGIMQFVREISKERVNLGPGTLYGALNTMVEKGWIQVIPNEGDKRKKEYEITSLGQEVVEEEILRLQELLDNGKKYIGGGKNEN